MITLKPTELVYQEKASNLSVELLKDDTGQWFLRVNEETIPMTVNAASHFGYATDLPSPSEDV
tara:strand:- start:61 stop:249 length:189 start_codon:yes stop_codon:yes gene_type:complete